jgi:cytochrome c oxidase subunit IV
MTIGPDIHPKRARPLPFVIAWAVMLVLAAVSLVTAFLGLGVWGPVIQFGIAALQVSALFILFMRLKGSPSLKWVFAITGFLWLSFLYGLSMTDYSNRRGWPPLLPTSGAGFETHQNGP